MNPDWRGVIPAITTPFRDDLSIDYEFFNQHCQRLVDAGCVSIVTGGSIGEATTLTPAEKISLVRAAQQAVGDRVPILAAVSALSTVEAIQLARSLASEGCAGLMVLPPYVYSTDWYEMKRYMDAVIGATDLPILLYNNPIAYATDFLPEQIAELAVTHGNLEAVKESSTDIRRMTALRAALGDRLEVLVGVDDQVVEGVMAGAVGWIAGLVAAFPEESVTLFNQAVALRNGTGSWRALEDLYAWFLPLLRLDTIPKLVQAIKLAQEQTGLGSARVRPPRQELVGEERDRIVRIIQHALNTRPSPAPITQ